MVLFFSKTVVVKAENDSPWLAVAAPENWEMSVGDSRTLEYLFADTKLRSLTWNSSDTAIAIVDQFGRVTAKGIGTASITAANGQGLQASVTLNVKKSPTKLSHEISGRVDYNGEAVDEKDSLQKFVDRFTLNEAKTSSEVPDKVKACIDDNGNLNMPSDSKTAHTDDGAVWTVTDYGVKRENQNEAIQRDRIQRFMGDRYFYENGSSVSGIFDDGSKGIWAFCGRGLTHIRMEELSPQDKAIQMSNTTQEYVSRRGMVNNASLENGEWVPNESDNDGLWTSMYGAGELFRYAVLKDQLKANPQNEALQKQVDEARKTAMLSTEAVLLLGNISCRTGTTQAYVRYQDNGGKWLSSEALIQGKDGSRKVPADCPALTADPSILLDPSHLKPFVSDSWKNPLEDNGTTTFAKQTRLLEGFFARTYILEGLDTECPESYDFSDGFYFDIDGNQATCKSGKTGAAAIINGEALKGVKVDASGEIPARLMKLIGSVENPRTGNKFTKDDIIYKGDTSCDEIIGHLFIYKLAYDILGPEDPELKQIITDTVEKFAKHVSDNSYMLVDATGQPTTWGKLNREFLSNSSTLTDAPLTASVLLSIFKLAAYTTGNQKWEDEYRMAALSQPYAYAELMAKYQARWEAYINLMASQLGVSLDGAPDKVMDMLVRSFLNYSDEEMAMLSFYLLFQMEDDEGLLNKYRSALDQWWKSMQYSENPLWYYIYQLAYPDEVKKDAYGNNLLDTAAWALSRHPVDMIQYSASNVKRDDIAIFDIGQIINQPTRGGLSYNKETSTIPNISDPRELLSFLAQLDLDYAVAPADERGLHKFNLSTYRLDTYYDVNKMEGSTTYTLPYWMGRYHKMLASSAVSTPVVDKTALQSAVVEAEKINLAEYTDSTGRVVKEKIEGAKQVLMDEAATQDEVDAAEKALGDAIKSLVKKTSLSPETGEDLSVVPIITLLLSMTGMIYLIYTKKQYKI